MPGRLCTYSRHTRPKRKKKVNRIDIPAAWENLNFQDASGVWMVIGATDTGKSTLSRYLYRRLLFQGIPSVLLDGDPGQSSLGPPATMTMVSAQESLDSSRVCDGFFPPLPPEEVPVPVAMWRSFIGDVSPHGHMLRMLAGAFRLCRKAEESGAGVIVYDTCGLIDPAQGGFALKESKIELLQPTIIFALQRERELEPFLIPLERSQRINVIRLSPSIEARLKSRVTRQEHRLRQFERYFAPAQTLTVNWRRLGVFPAPRFAVGMLVALEDRDSFTQGLGIIREIDHRRGRLSLLTRLNSLSGVQALRLGDISINL
jgi:polynucleotide 5'-hydroxyl-kinase GRC3/NOL9